MIETKAVEQIVLFGERMQQDQQTIHGANGFCLFVCL